jgi:hypothetical protein
MPAVIHLSVPPRIVREIKDAAKAAFPKETYFLLIGTTAGDQLHIDELYVPDDVDRHTTPWAVNPQPHWMMEAQELASETYPDAMVLGWGHSHSFVLGEVKGRVRDHAQSEGDIDFHPAGLLISAVCVVQEFQRKGRFALRASVRFWGPTIPVQVKFE